jgi:hypothetical protein
LRDLWCKSQTTLYLYLLITFWRWMLSTRALVPPICIGRIAIVESKKFRMTYWSPAMSIRSLLVRLRRNSTLLDWGTKPEWNSFVWSLLLSVWVICNFGSS